MRVEAKLRPASINMPNKGMANNLKSEDLGFFEVSKYPVVTFKSTGMEMIEDSVYKLTGMLTIKEITNELILDVKFNGWTSPLYKTMPGFTIHGKIHLPDFGLGGTAILPGNGLPVIGKDVYITSNVRLGWVYDD